MLFEINRMITPFDEYEQVAILRNVLATLPDVEKRVVLDTLSKEVCQRIEFKRKEIERNASTR